MGASDAQKPPPRRRTLRLAAWLGASVVLLALLLLVGIPLPLGPFHEQIESAASEALGRAVRFGSLRLRLGIHPRVSIEELRLAHVLEDRPDVLGVEQIELELGLVGLIDRRIHLRRVAVQGANARIDPEAFPESEPGPDDAGVAEPEARDGAPWMLDVLELAVSEVELAIHRPDLEPTRAGIENLTGHLLWDETLELAFSGTYRDVPVSARIEGASLARLLEGAEAWPLQLDAELAGSPLQLAATLATVGDAYRIGDLRGRAVDTSIAGWLALEDLASRPRASGRIELGDIELALPERREPRAPRGAPAKPVTLPGEAETRATLALGTADEGPGPIAVFIGLLRDFETDLELEISRIAGFGPTVEELSVALRVAGGALRFPVSLKADGIPLSGMLHLEEIDELPHLAFTLAAKNARVDELAATLLPGLDVAGSFDELGLELEGSGYSLLAFLETLRVDLHMADAALRYGVERPVPFGVERLELALARQGPITLGLRGDLLGESVRLDLSGGTMQTFLTDEPWPLRLEVEGAGATVELTGEAVGYLDSLDLLGDLRVQGDRLSSLEPWLGPLPVPDGSYTLRARIEDTPTGTRVELQEVRLGETNLTGELGGLRREGDPLLSARLRIEHLDVSPYLEATRRAPPPEAAAGGDDDDAIEIEAPILPGGVQIRDADLDLGIDRFVYGRLELGDLRFAGSFREGFLPDSTFGLRLGRAGFEGTARVDLRQPPHSARFALGARDVDVGRLLSDLGVAKGIDATARSLRVELEGEGATLGGILQKSDFLARLDGARWRLRDPNSSGTLDFVLDEGVLTSPQGGEPIRVAARGSLKGIPVRLSMRTEPLSFFRAAGDHVPVDLKLDMAGASLTASSMVSLPIEQTQLELSLTLEGRSLEDASELFDYELPPIGPYRIAGRMQLTPDDYRLSELDVRVGASRLGGSGRLDTRGARTRIEVELESDRLQLDDFAAAMPDDEPAASPSGPSDAEEILEFWSPEGLLGFDGRLAVRVRQVLSGEDELGQGNLVATLANGKLTLDPLHLELPGGPFDLRAEYAFTGEGVSARIRANTDDFDYGVLARRLDRETRGAGLASLDVDVSGEAPDTRSLLAHASGHLDFRLSPENIQTNVFDLWAVSLLSFLVPHLDAGPRSTLNCVVGRFDLVDGILEEKALLLDTTGMVVQGDAIVDFDEEQFRALLDPRPKRPQIFSLEPRIAVWGDFQDFRIGVPPKEFLVTLARFATSAVIAPIRFLFTEPLPADGEETCRAAWEEPRQ